MKEIRITFSGEDFAAVSKSMIDLGVSFQVEPVEPADEAAPSSPAAPRRRQGKRKPAKPGRQGGSSEGGDADRLADREGSGAAKLRAMVERNRAGAGRSAGDRESSGEGNGTPAADTMPPDEDT